MTTTALDIITDALRMLGVYAPGETLSDADAEQGLITLNDMMDSWSNESLACIAVLEQHYTLVPGTAAYTIGSGGTINQTRPLKIIKDPGTAYVQDANGNNYPMEVVERDRWNMIGNRSQVNSNFPTVLFYDPEFPLGILNFFPVPNSGYTAYWDSLLQLSEFSNLQSTLSLPPGYKMAIQSNLALELKPYFLDPAAQLDPLLVRKASDSKGNIKRTNIREVIAVYDTELVSRASPTYNVFRDSGY